MSAPKVSVVMPIYNVEKYLWQCMESVAGQSLRDIEIIPVNDGSPDGCAALIDEYAKRDPRIKPIHKENGGYGSAVNAGLEKACGDYVSIIETDDYVESNMLEMLYAQAVKYQADISRGSYYVVQNDEIVSVEKTLGSLRPAFNVSEYPQFLVTPPAIWSAIYKRSCLEKNSIRVIDSPGAAYQDVDFFVRTAVVADRIVCTDRPYYFYRLDNPNSSTNSLSKAKAIFDHYKKTDYFMYSMPGLPKQILYFYEKRKICDYQWHFRRIGGGAKYQFALRAREELLKVDEHNVLPLLSSGQRRFLTLILKVPFFYSLYSSAIALIR